MQYHRLHLLRVVLLISFFVLFCFVVVFFLSGLSLRAGGRGFSPATKRVAPRLLLLENRRKIEPKGIPSRLIPLLLVVFTRQLEILMTTLSIICSSEILALYATLQSEINKVMIE